MSSVSQERYFQVMMTFTYRRHLLDDTNPTAPESEGRSAMNATHESQIAMSMHLGRTSHANLHPSKVRNQMMKMPCIWARTTTNARSRRPNTCHHESRPKPYASRTCSVAKRIGSSMSSLGTCTHSRCGIWNMPPFMHFPHTSFLTLSAHYLSPSIDPAQLWPPTPSKPCWHCKHPLHRRLGVHKYQHLPHRRLGVHKFQHQFQLQHLQHPSSTLLPRSSTRDPRPATSAPTQAIKFATAAQQKSTSTPDVPPSLATVYTCQITNRSRTMAHGEESRPASTLG